MCQNMVFCGKGLTGQVYQPVEKTGNQHYLLFPKSLSPIPKRQILDSSKDDYFKCDENDQKLSKKVENILEQGEIACYEQFLLFPPCFQKKCILGKNISLL